VTLEQAAEMFEPGAMRNMLKVLIRVKD